MTYSGNATGYLVMSGTITLGSDLTLDVLTGTTNNNSGAVLDVAGLIDDGTATQGLIKTGDGILKLAAGNTYGGSTTLRRGVLSITDTSALGNGTAPLTFEGGCFHAAAAMTLARDVVVTSGGSMRVDAPNVLELAGNIDWVGGTSYLYGSGRTILTGTTTGTSGDLVLGIPGPFATTWNTTSGFEYGQVLSLRGNSSLPAGNLRIINDAVLELGNDDFTRPLGTAAGDVLLDTNRSAGWAAFGANRTVNLGGAGASITWGQTTPPFLFKFSGPNHVGDLILGSATATHTVDFQNPLELNNGETFITRAIIVPDGPAALEARVSGDIHLNVSPDTYFTNLDLLVSGALEISGDITGPLTLSMENPGTATLSGHNSFTGGYYLYAGTLVIAGDDSYGIADEIQIDEGAQLDASAMTTPVTTSLFGNVYLYGTLNGNVTVSGELWGSGTITGELVAQDGAYFYPTDEAVLHVGGDFTLNAGAFLSPAINANVDPVSVTQMRVTGAVNLAGTLNLGVFGTLPETATDFVLLLNDGTDPINGTFDGLPEGALIPFFDGTALRVTYLANGDGGSVGNDFGVSYVPSSSGADLALRVSAPLFAATGGPVNLSYAVDNSGPYPANNSVFHLILPANATFVDSTPAGTIDLGVLSIPLPTVDPGMPKAVDLQFIAPAVPAAVIFDASVDLPGDPALANNSRHDTVAAIANGQLEIAEMLHNPLSGTLSLSINTLSGVNYRLENSLDLEIWHTLQDFIGDGETFTIDLSTNLSREFFRFSIVP